MTRAHAATVEDGRGGHRAAAGLRRGADIAAKSSGPLTVPPVLPLRSAIGGVFLTPPATIPAIVNSAIGLRNIIRGLVSIAAVLPHRACATQSD